MATPALAAPGHRAHYDCEYVRNGVANLFMVFEPFAGQREVNVTDRRTKKDYALCLRKISDQMYPEAEIIVLMQDNLHSIPLVLRVSRQTRRVVQQNITLSLVLKLAVLGLAIPGIASLWLAVLADVGATLIVTLNGMRLLRAR